MDEENALIESLANSQHDINTNSQLNNLRTATVPTTTTTTTQAATTSKAKNCRGLIQKRAHTLDDFMEGNREICECTIKRQSDHNLCSTEPRPLPSPIIPNRWNFIAIGNAWARLWTTHFDSFDIFDTLSLICSL